MNILIVSDYMFVGGIATYITGLSTALMKTGAYVKVIAGDCAEKPEQTFNIPYIIVNAPHHSFFLWLIIEFLNIFSRAYTCLLNEQYDYVVLNTPVSALAVLLVARILKKRPKFVYQFHGAVDLEEQNIDLFWDNYLKRTLTFTHRLRLIYRNIKYQTVKAIQAFVLKNVDTVITFSIYASDLITNHFLFSQQQIHILKPGLPIQDHFTESDRKSKILRGWFNTEIPLIVAVSRIEPRKGIFLLVDALQELDKLRKKFHAVIYSDFRGNLSFIKILIDKINASTICHKILLIQNLNNETKKQLIAEANLMVVPSLALETFGFVSLEALSMGTPVCAFDIGANKEVIACPKKLLMRKPTVQNMVETIGHYLSTRSITNSMREEIKKKVMTYSWKRYIHDAFR